MLSLTVSVLSLMLIAVDRFIATLFPLKATLINPRVKAALLSATWLISITQCILLFHSSRLAEIGPQIFFCTVTWNSLPLMSFFMASVVLYNFTPLIVIVITYSCIMHTLKTRQQGQVSEASSSQRNRAKENQNVLKIFRSIVLAFFVCICLFGLYLILLTTLHEIHTIDKCRYMSVFTHKYPSLWCIILALDQHVMSAILRLECLIPYPFTPQSVNPIIFQFIENL